MILISVLPRPSRRLATHDSELQLIPVVFKCSLYELRGVSFLRPLSLVNFWTDIIFSRQLERFKGESITTLRKLLHVIPRSSSVSSLFFLFFFKEQRLLGFFLVAYRCTPFSLLTK